jgi:hypothetical protein
VNVQGRYTRRRDAERRRDWHNQVDRPHPTGIDRELWVSWHGEPLTYVVEPIDHPEYKWAVVGYGEGEPRD